MDSRRFDGGSDLDDRSVSDLVKQLSDQTAALVRQELDLAKAELTIKGKRAGIGAGLFGSAGLVALYAVGALTAAAILGLSTAIAGWLAALIVGAAYAAAAAALALTGKSEVQRATPPVPKQAVDSVKEDVQWTRQRAQAAKR